jgi:transcriptional regulator with XRE-family HTH domain
MSETIQPPLLEDIDIAQGRRGVLVDALEEWLETEAPRVLGVEAAASWTEGYWILRRRGVPHRDAMLAVWLSLSKDDRGVIGTREELANVMGVSRATTYDWEAKRPEIRRWAEFLQVLRMRGNRLAEVDEKTYDVAVSEDSSAADRKLFYQRAGVWEDKEVLKVIETGDVEEGFFDPIEWERKARERLRKIQEMDECADTDA